MKKCPVTILKRLFGFGQPTRLPFYDDLIGMQHLRRAIGDGVLTDDINEHLFYYPHQQIELDWMYTEKIVDHLATHFKVGTLTKPVFLNGISKVAEILRQVNHKLGMMPKFLSPAEFKTFREILKPASGFQSSYHKMEFVLTDPAYLMHKDTSKAACPYWQKSSVSACALADMMKRQDFTALAKRWQHKNLAHLYFNTQYLMGDAEVMNALGRVDKFFGEGFKKAHLTLVNLFLPDEEVGSAGSIFRTYLGESANVKLYPFLP